MNTKQLHKILNIGCLVSVILIIIRIVFFDTPELFKGGSIILDDVIYDLSIAFISSSFFYYLLVYIPANRDREKISVYTYYLSGMISSRSLGLFEALRESINMPQKDKLSAQDVETIALAVNPNSQAPIVIDPINRINGTWWNYLADSYYGLSNYIEKIMPYMYFMDSDHIELINNIQKSGFYRQFSRMPNVRITNTDLSFLTKELQEIYELSLKLREYIDKK
ncbi:hypothetical protein D2A34_22000 [Clostridium chromiireducens]|uniref:Uncharacterized protein n=1 Tax=Clostridium chromiireducens TaxID=225345 RepID=A0A399IIZ3_9CLOT|nr:hypothetical protein [Clostridium chromiireducens]RII32871.1 hypothetical protein D2A34_22000 [Clostridium chromiireducens]